MPDKKILSYFIIQKFLKWSGHEVFFEAMQRFPEIKIYLCGGVVRDSILRNNRIANDFDLIIENDNYGLLLKFLEKRGYLTFGQFGSPRWLQNEYEKIYCDLMFVHRFNAGLSECKTVEDVLKQFDFTGNAIAINLNTKEIIDPVDGIEDLNKKELRAVRLDFPNKTIGPNSNLTIPAVHWFRYLYYASVLNLYIESKTKKWLSDNEKYIAHYNNYFKEFVSIEKGSSCNPERSEGSQPTEDARFFASLRMTFPYDS